MNEKLTWVSIMLATVIVMLCLGLYFITQNQTVEECMRKGYTWEYCTR
jgi:hypothetical protein